MDIFARKGGVFDRTVGKLAQKKIE